MLPICPLMTGANSALPTLPSANPNSATHFKPSLSILLQNATCLVPTYPTYDLPEEEYDEGEDLSDLWSAMEDAKLRYTVIRDCTRDLQCPLLDLLTVDDLLELLYPEIHDQLKSYILEK